jgi:NAD(P)-dependent dehydrogenase (short-subunit alcohol dehydrogenase family)
MFSFINDPNELKGRRALVTGGSRGIGGAIVGRLVSAGARVVAVARHPGENFPAEAAFQVCKRSWNRRYSTVWIFW